MEEAEYVLFDLGHADRSEGKRHEIYGPYDLVILSIGTASTIA